MSLMNTVTKLAVGFAMAKGMDAVKRKGGIGAVMEDLTKQVSTASAGSGGGLGDLLTQLGAGGGAAGGLGDVLGKLSGGMGGGQTAGGLGGLGALLGGLATARDGGGGGLEALINQDNPSDEPSEDELARLMLRAMTQAAQADGKLDNDERNKLLKSLQGADAAEIETVQAMLDAPVDPAALAADTPRGSETQVYTMSVNAITPDNQAERQFLHALAQGLGLSPDTVNKIHDGLGVPRLYA